MVILMDAVSCKDVARAPRPGHPTVPAVVGWPVPACASASASALEIHHSTAPTSTGQLLSLRATPPMSLR